MLKLSVVIITFNEEHNIGRCLDSVKEVADEIIVLDSFSTDRTAEICRASGARVIQQQFLGHIEQKNLALKYVTYKHVLSLDADEALSPELIQNIRKLKTNWELDGYVLNRLTNYCGQWIRHGGWYPDRKLRLFILGAGYWGGSNPHDRFIPDRPENTGRLAGDILHYSYYSIEEHINQVNKFTGIGAQSAYDKGIRASIPVLLIKPAFKFIRTYILLRGFLDGYYGLVIARISAHATFLKYVKLREIQKKPRGHA